MSINKTLAKERGISQEDQDKIEELQNLLDKLINSAVEEGYPDEQRVLKLVRDTEFCLQGLWGYVDDESYHTWSRYYVFRNQWVGRKFQCKDTGVEFVIPASVNFRDLFEIGNGYLDVGDGYYSRKGGNVVEVV